ncbi:hypothetical protein [Aeromonas phage AerS_266]|nr:hypothetical protein [Aeromonas phage AerS_266]
MHQVSFPVKELRINIFRMVYTDRDGDISPALVLIAGEESKEELLQVPDCLSENFDLSDQVDYYVENLDELCQLMFDDHAGSAEMRETMLKILQNSNYEPRCFEIAEEDFQAILVIAETAFDGRLRVHWDPVDELDAFEDLSNISGC